MTQHRLVHCPSPAQFSRLARQAHVPCVSWRSPAFRHWRCGQGEARASAVHWVEWLPGIGVIGCCLDSEQGATGVVAHLTASVIGAAGPWPEPVRQLIVQRWTRRTLGVLAAGIEAGGSSKAS